MRERMAAVALLLSLLLFPTLAIAAPDAAKGTLAAAVQRALDRNPTVAVAVDEIQRADALVTQARAGFLPTLIGNGAYTRLDHDRFFGMNRVASANQLAGNLQLTVPLVAAPAWTA